MKILIVDDNVDSVKSASMYLGQCGFATEGAYSGRGAENVLSQDEFDVVMLDYRIDDLNGLDLLRWMRASGIITPAILTTGVAPDIVDHIRSSADAERLGPLVVMNKPYQGEALVTTIGILASHAPGTTTKITHTVEDTTTVTRENVTRDHTGAMPQPPGGG